FNIGMKEGVWGRKMSKCIAKQHRTCRSFGFPKYMVDQRQQTIEKQMQKAISELTKHALKLHNDTKLWQPSVDPNILSHVINELVKSTQYRLRQEFDYKKIMLAMNSNDHRLITEFCNLQPNDEQKYLAKKIWQTTADLFKAKDQDEVLHRRASLKSNYSKTVTQYKFDLMTLNLDTIQNVIRGHQTVLSELETKLSEVCHSSMIVAIGNRRKAMKERHEVYLKHKLNTFFDEAPMTSNE
ncbi:unnamed protein product, partial [Rotaria socialis]